MARRLMLSTRSSTRWCRTRHTNSLLKSRRQELHGKIARVIEQRFPHIKTTEPEVLAHHLTAADLTGDVSPNRRKFRQDKFSPATIASRSITCPLSRKV